VIGFYAFIVVGLAPFGALQAGWIGEQLGVRATAAIGGGVCLLVATMLMMRREGREGRESSPIPSFPTLPTPPADKETQT
jgi:hypothetical protein